MKKIQKILSIALSTSILLLSQSIVADASWLSKAIDRLEDSAKYDKINKNRKNLEIGHLLPKEDLVVAGVPLGAYIDDIKQSLGRPTNEKKSNMQAELVYGGITFRAGPFSHGKRADSIYINNRDATTARGIAVGDSLKMVEAAYGKPDQKRNNQWFYGYERGGSDFKVGITFYHDGKKVTGIGYEST